MTERAIPVLTVLLVLCAISLVHARYQSRSLFIELEREQAHARQLEVDWSQLQLDQSTLGVHARIEAIARRDLHMVLPGASNTQYLMAGK